MNYDVTVTSEGFTCVVPPRRYYIAPRLVSIFEGDTDPLEPIGPANTMAVAQGIVVTRGGISPRYFTLAAGDLQQVPVDADHPAGTTMDYDGIPLYRLPAHKRRGFFALNLLDSDTCFFDLYPGEMPDEYAAAAGTGLLLPAGGTTSTAGADDDIGMYVRVGAGDSATLRILEW